MWPAAAQLGTSDALESKFKALEGDDRGRRAGRHAAAACWAARARGPRCPRGGPSGEQSQHTVCCRVYEALAARGRTYPVSGVSPVCICRVYEVFVTEGRPIR